MLSVTEELVIIIVALLGGFVGKKSKLPGSALLCSTIAVAAACLTFDLPHAPPEELILFMQLLTGCLLGQSINRRFWYDFLQIWPATLVQVGIFTLVAIPFAGLLIREFAFSPVLAILAASPARMQDMIILASTMDADAVTVMIMQFTRLLCVILATPFIVSRYGKPIEHKAGREEKSANGSRKSRFPKVDAGSLAMLMVPACMGAGAGYLTGHTLGTLLGSFFFVAASRLIWLRAGEVPFPKSFAFLIQSLAGILLGVRITPEIGGLLLDRLAPVSLACVSVLGGGFCIMSVLHRRFGWNKALSWMAAAPGRTADILAISQDIELTPKDRLALVCMHTVRQIYFTLFVTMAVSLF